VREYPAKFGLVGLGVGAQKQPRLVHIASMDFEVLLESRKAK
jgi:hypothetical protein